MMLKVMIKNQTDRDTVISPDFQDKLKELVELTVKSEVDISSEKEISLTFMNNKEVKKLNARYRDKDEPTDVLAFPLEGKILGEVVVSVEQAEKQAEDYKHSLYRELGFLIIHGVLHLLGYDHKNKSDRAEMKAKENEYLQEFPEFRK